MVKEDTLYIEFKKKFTTIDFENYLETYFNKCSSYKNIIFQLTNIEWIALEELTFLFAWIRYLKHTHPNLNSIKINLPNLNPEEDNDSYKRRKQRLLNLWNVWKIWQKCDLNFSEETNIDSSINKYVDKIQYDSHWHHIIPFTKLDPSGIIEFRDIREKVEKNIYERFDLNAQVEQILAKYSSLTPFENKALSGIISTELYLNSIIHAYNTEDYFRECYFAVALRNKININEYKEKKEERGEILEEAEIKRRIDFILTENLKEKDIDEKSYFEAPGNKNISSNDSYLEFSFLDFGVGIPKRLREQYNNCTIESLPLSISHSEKNLEDVFTVSEDSRILEYAFLLDSSSNPYDRRLEINDYVPRGLFFLVDIIRRYRGLLVVRSGKGKIIYNFKHTSIISEAVYFSKYDSKLSYFNGTLITIYLPAKNENDLLISRKIEINLENKKKKGIAQEKSQIIEYLNINEIIKLNTKALNGGSLTEVYNSIFKRLNEKIDSFKYKNCTVYIDFSGTENLEIINRKLYFYLCNSPRFNSETKVIVVHPTNLGELFQAKQAIKASKLPIYRPIPCFIYDNKKKIQIIWLGISDEQDEELLNNSVLLKTQKGYNIDKFINKYEVVGNVITLDEGDFVKINIDNISNILEHYSSKFIYEEIPRLFLAKYLSNDKSILNQPKIVQEDKSLIYWTSGGYYQEKFINLIDLLYSYESINIGNRGETLDEHFGERVARYLIEKYNYCNRIPLDIDYIVTVTLSSQLLGKHIKDMYHRLILNESSDHKKPELIRLAHYHEFTLEKAFIRIKEGKKVLIVNDVISTGKLSNELYHKLTELKKADIVAIFTLIDSRDINSKDIKHFYDKTVDQSTYKLIDYPIEKFKSKNPLIKTHKREVISIDPVINSPSMMKLERSMGENILYFENKSNAEKGNDKFLDNFTNPEHLWIGHLNHNVAHHSYYFKTHEIILSDNGDRLLKEIFEFISRIELKEGELNYVFHPMFSAIEALTNNKLKDILSKSLNFFNFPLPRIDTPKGWRFTFPPKLLNAKGWNFTRRNVLIIDDGSCSGDTLLQMIDSIAMIEVNKIVVVSIIARLEDFQREFFSRLTTIKGFKKYNPHVVLENDTWDSISAKYEMPKEELIKHNIAKIIPGDIIGIPQSETTSKNVPISIYFGTHFHIPVYSPLKHCPFCHENSILKEEQNSLVDPPDSVTEYITKRIKELTLYETDGTPSNQEDLEDYTGTPSYLPKEIDLKKVFIARDTIGKIDTYRLYRDYIKDSYDNIEIDYYLAVLLHESRLIDSISHLLPHLKANLLNAIKNYFGIKSNNENIKLTLKWLNIQLIKALLLLCEESFLDINHIKLIVDSINEDDLDSINYLSYIYWKKLKTNKNINHITTIIYQIWTFLGDKKNRKVWGQFQGWILNQQRHPFTEGFSFQYLKDFYIRKESEYPNHLIIGREFLALQSRMNGLKYKIVEGKLSKARDDDYLDKKRLFIEASAKLKYPFLDVLKDKEFKKIIELSGYYDRFYSEDVSAISLLDKIQELFNNEGSIENIEKIISKLDLFIDFYIKTESIFATFFIKHETNPLAIINNIKEEYLSKLQGDQIKYNDKITLKDNLLTGIHPECFTFIISELFQNCIKHTKEIKSIRASIKKVNSMSINIHNDEHFVFINYNHGLNIKKGKKLELSGLKKTKTIAKYFGGTFDFSDLDNEFNVSISLPIVKREYNF